MILVDTSVWINYFRGHDSSETVALTETIQNNEDVCVSGIIFTEILQGIPDDKEYRSVKALLNTFVFLPMPLEAYGLAADIYRHAKKKGHTIRNTVDCLISACAITHEVPLLQEDKDYLTIAKFSKLKLAV